MNLGNSTITLKDGIQWALMLISALLFFTGLSSKVDNLNEKVESIMSSTEKRDEKREVYDKAIQNQVSTTTLQLELLKQDFERFKESAKSK